MADLPILPIKTDALLADTSHLSAEEFGAYCRILFVMWRHDARLADDPSELARIAGVPLRRWMTMSDRVLRPMTSAGGILSQKRLTATWLDVQELRKKRAHAAEKRWSSTRNANASAKHEQLESKSNANQISKNITSTPVSTAATSRVDSPVEPSKPARSVATALVDGALPRLPTTEQAEGKQEAIRKHPAAMTRADWEARFAAKNAPSGGTA